MIIDGRQIARDLKNKIKSATDNVDMHLSLGIIVTEETPAIRQFVTLKQNFGKSVRINVEVLTLKIYERDTQHLLELLLHATKTFDGIVLQLPISLHLSLENVLKIYPLTHDVDVLGYTAYQQFKEGNLPFLPPVVGAFEEILKRNNVKLAGKNVLVVGEGRLVGAPAVIWAKRFGATVTVATKETSDLVSLTQNADILMLGAGVPGLIQPHMVKEGVIILDAGTGEEGGVVKGDADPACAEKASLFTPTPGGIGPITVAKVFENLLILHDIVHPKSK
jgi:methylenetetrahydrofolate dehydrogenase (NADP+) / methenyltetrahydrofolate cyclohydrolase